MKRILTAFAAILLLAGCSEDRTQVLKVYNWSDYIDETVILAHITFCTPYVVLSVLPKLQQMNPNIYEAALDLGATPSQALWKVLVPELRPGMVSGFILAFTMSLDDFAVTFFTRGTIGLDTLSTYIYTDARKGGLTPELRPLMTLIFLVILILLVIINLRQDRLQKQNENR